MYTLLNFHGYHHFAKLYQLPPATPSSLPTQFWVVCLLDYFKENLTNFVILSVKYFSICRLTKMGIFTHIPDIITNLKIQTVHPRTY